MKLRREDISEYLVSLKKLIQETVDLPQVAKDQFIGQWTEERLLQSIDSWIFLVEKDESRITGLILGTPHEGGVGTIIWVLVDPKFQGKKIGSTLFNEACQVYKQKGAHKIKLTVPDHKTVQFYEKQGMTLEGEHPNHWWNQDFWAMGYLL